jgi:hypothetical protein
MSSRLQIYPFALAALLAAPCSAKTLKVLTVPPVKYVKTDSIRGQTVNNWANTSHSVPARAFRLFKFIRGK